MLTEPQILELIEQHVEECIHIGKANQRFSQSVQAIRLLPRWNPTLKDLHTWGAIKTLCEVLEIDSLPYWNRICTECPNLGDITDP